MTGRLLAIARRARPRAPMETLTEGVISAEAGLEGDARGTRPGRQITLLFDADWNAACEALGAEAPWLMRRANLLIGALDNPRRIGVRLRVGPALLEVTEETEPCSVMERQRAGLRAALAPEWRGGVCAVVLEGGPIRVGDAVEVAGAPRLG